VALRGIFGTYTGWNSASYFCEEVRDPGHSIARATFLALAVITAIYVLVNVALLSVLSPGEMAGSNLVAADAAARVFGPGADPVVTAISLISLVTIANATIMIFPRVVYAIARDAGIPGLMHVADNGTPRLALLVTVIAAALLATVGVYDILLSFSAALMVAMGACVNAAAIAMRLRHPQLERPYAMPLFPLPAIFALLVNTSLLVLFVIEDPVIVAEAFALLAVLTVVVYAVTRRARLA
jgi:APA family basic amino acid/polyamine antiporter